MSDTDTQWVRITFCGNIPPREGRAIRVGGRELAVFNLGERFVATENRCPHRNGPLADGIISGQSIVCPLHAWKFDLESGACVNHPGSESCLSTFPVRIESGIILVELPCAPSQAKTPPRETTHRDRPLRWVQRKPFTPSDEHAAEA
jgi:nitrite reductase (NADH) small subunit